MIRIVNLGPVIRRPKTSFHLPDNGTGNLTPLLLSISGYAAKIACIS